MCEERSVVPSIAVVNSLLVQWQLAFPQRSDQLNQLSVDVGLLVKVPPLRTI